MNVGIFELGYEKVHLRLVAGTGGTFETMPDGYETPLVSVGADLDDFVDVLVILLHEVTELSSVRHGVRYAQTGTIARDNGEYTFIIPHTVFSDIIACAAEFMLHAQKPLMNSWKQWKKEHKK